MSIFSCFHPSKSIRRSNSCAESPVAQRLPAVNGSAPPLPHRWYSEGDKQANDSNRSLPAPPSQWYTTGGIASSASPLMDGGYSNFSVPIVNHPLYNEDVCEGRISPYDVSPVQNVTDSQAYYVVPVVQDNQSYETYDELKADGKMLLDQVCHAQIWLEGGDLCARYSSIS